MRSPGRTRRPHLAWQTCRFSATRPSWACMAGTVTWPLFLGLKIREPIELAIYLRRRSRADPPITGRLFLAASGSACRTDARSTGVAEPGYLTEELPGLGPARMGRVARPPDKDEQVSVPNASSARPDSGGCQVRAAGFLPWLARHGRAWRWWRDVVGGRRCQRRPFDGRGDVGGGLPVLTYLTYPRTVAKPPDSTC
jgi:hypothetical protein